MESSFIGVNEAIGSTVTGFFLPLSGSIKVEIKQE